MVCRGPANISGTGWAPALRSAVYPAVLCGAAAPGSPTDFGRSLHSLNEDPPAMSYLCSDNQSVSADFASLHR